MSGCYEMGCDHEDKWYIERREIGGGPPKMEHDKVHWRSCGVHLGTLVARATKTGTMQALVGMAPETGENA